MEFDLSVTAFDWFLLKRMWTSIYMLLVVTGTGPYWFILVCLQFVIVVFPDHTHLLFLNRVWTFYLFLVSIGCFEQNI